MTRLLDWCVPASALTWGRLTKVWPLEITITADTSTWEAGMSDLAAALDDFRRRTDREDPTA